MPRAFRTKRFAVALGVVVVLATAGIVLAFFSASGSGTSNAQVGTSSALAITPTITAGAGGIVPGGNPSTVSFSVNNPGSGKQYVGTVTMTSVTAYSDAARTVNITGTGAGKCDTTQFSMAPVTENQTIPSGTTTLTNNGSLVFADSGANQDGCKNAYLTANVTSN